MDSFIGTSKSLQIVYRKHFSQPEYVIIFQIAKTYTTSGFWPRVRAPVFLGSLLRPTGRCAPPAHRSYAAPLKIKINYFQKKNVFLQARTRPLGAYIFQWAKLHSSELHCTFLFYAAPS